jgi:hypothetical protein
MGWGVQQAQRHAGCKAGSFVSYGLRCGSSAALWDCAIGVCDVPACGMRCALEDVRVSCGAAYGVRLTLRSRHSSWPGSLSRKTNSPGAKASSFSRVCGVRGTGGPRPPSHRE